MVDKFDFTNQTGIELLQLLARRVEERLSPRSDQERFQALLGPALVLLAEIFRETVENADDPRQSAQMLLDFSDRWILQLLGIAGEDTT
jgi:hypothetical protein